MPLDACGFPAFLKRHWLAIALALGKEGENYRLGRSRHEFFAQHSATIHCIAMYAKRPNSSSRWIWQFEWRARSGEVIASEGRGPSSPAHPHNKRRRVRAGTARYRASPRFATRIQWLLSDISNHGDLRSIVYFPWERLAVPRSDSTGSDSTPHTPCAAAASPPERHA